jgi:hypothetical protein
LVPVLKDVRPWGRYSPAFSSAEWQKAETRGVSAKVAS